MMTPVMFRRVDASWQGGTARQPRMLSESGVSNM
jgi:hypothetical protein